VFATVLEKVYKTGLKITEDLKQTMEIIFDDYCRDGIILPSQRCHNFGFYLIHIPYTIIMTK
jgi:hypothetical protein